MSIKKQLKKDIGLLFDLINEHKTIAKGTRKYCEKMGLDYTDSYRKQASVLYNKHGQVPKLDGFNPETFQVPSGAKITGGWVKNKKQSLRFSMPAVTQDKKDTFREDLMRDLKAFSPKVPKPNHVDYGDCLLELCLPDFHIGRDQPEAEKKLFESAVWSITDRATKNYSISKIQFPVGNDFLNTDNIQYGTTKGTAQFDYVKWYESFRNGWTLLASNILELGKLCPVNVSCILGNHDKTRMFSIGEVLQAYFHNNEHITVENEVNKFLTFKFGKNFVMYDHGENKMDSYPLIMATEYPKEFADSIFREVHTGHLHKEMLNEFRGVKVRFLPSLAKNSDWEKKKYKHQRQAQGLVWHKDGGLIDIINYNVQGN